VFGGKFCVAAVRTLKRNSTEDWEQIAADSTGTVVSECLVDETAMGEEDECMVDGDEGVGDEDEEA
jgi:hypothetical protein